MATFIATRQRSTVQARPNRKKVDNTILFTYNAPVVPVINGCYLKGCHVEEGPLPVIIKAETLRQIERRLGIPDGAAGKEDMVLRTQHEVESFLSSFWGFLQLETQGPEKESFVERARNDVEEKVLGKLWPGWNTPEGRAYYLKKIEEIPPFQKEPRGRKSVAPPYFVATLAHYIHSDISELKKEAKRLGARRGKALTNEIALEMCKRKHGSWAYIGQWVIAFAHGHPAVKRFQPLNVEDIKKDIFENIMKRTPKYLGHHVTARLLDISRETVDKYCKDYSK
jgi:hypothetical protein